MEERTLARHQLSTSAAADSTPSLTDSQLLTREAVFLIYPRVILPDGIYALCRTGRSLRQLMPYTSMPLALTELLASL